ncbi:hypothetical protein [Microcoleus vaginatus]|uniref:hypothetical protein n=1 Tax=Microcoleus vaginatus TaxID=119532 RepID=UPI001F623E70|nr:hypothetical protein D0A37_16790 [Microcoleus vaginatus HSN003]
MSINSSSIDRKPADSAQKPTLSIAVPRYKTLLLTRSRLIRAIPYPSGTPAGNGIASFHAFLSDGSHNSQILFYET